MATSRRKFIKSASALGVLSTHVPLLSSCFSKQIGTWKNEKITKIELFKYDINIPRYFSFGTWLNRQHLFMKLSAGDCYGWSEIPASRNNPEMNPRSWVEYVRQFKSLTVQKAQNLLRSQQVAGSKASFKELEFMDMALLDLAGRLQDKSAVELLNLPHRKAVPGLYCILHKDENKVREEAEKSIEQNLGHHMKFKMYGEQAIDLKLLRIIREVLGNEAVVIADVNEGYKKWTSLDELAAILRVFGENGLNAIEDPARLDVQEWVKLQEMVGDLALIPDKPLRPAWRGIDTITPGMGRIYNLHPSTMAGFQQSAELARKVRQIGGGVMIGDDSLVGPACSAWQQIAIGSGAAWVEAIEKEEDSKDYLDCVVKSSTVKDANGYYSLEPSPGFGLELDVKCLKQVTSMYINV